MSSTGSIDRDSDSIGDARSLLDLDVIMSNAKFDSLFFLQFHFIITVLFIISLCCHLVGCANIFLSLFCCLFTTMDVIVFLDLDWETA